MKTLQVSNHNHAPDQPEKSGLEPTPSPQNEDILAWEPVGDDLWLPHRIRGSWRGGVLG